jgi:hypothetical protein
MMHGTGSDTVYEIIRIDLRPYLYDLRLVIGPTYCRRVLRVGAWRTCKHQDADAGSDVLSRPSPSSRGIRLFFRAHQLLEHRRHVSLFFFPANFIYVPRAMNGTDKICECVCTRAGIGIGD